MQMSKPMYSSSSSASDYGNQQRDPDNSGDQLTATISFQFNQSLQLDKNANSNSQKPLPYLAGYTDDEDEEEFVDCEDNEQDNNHEGDADFTFVYLGENNSPIPADKASKNGQIQPVFPLFDQNLLSGEDGNQLPIQPPVEKVFIESSQRAPSSSTSEYDENERIASGPYCNLSKQPVTDNSELTKKSNSTGFSKLWRLTGMVGRSNSDSRDAFVFRTTPSSKSVAKRTAVGGSSVKGNSAGGGKTKVVKKGTKAQNGNLSAHEVYLRKREQTEERRKSYLPYRPEIMGFFTNVNGGLSRNVHPY